MKPWDDSSFAERWLSHDAPPVDLALARERLERRLRAGRAPAWRPLHSGIAGLVAAAAIALAFVFTPLGGYANAFLTIFEPKAFTTIDVSQADFRSMKLLPQAGEFGTLREVLRSRTIDVASLAAAGARAGFSTAMPGPIPANLPKVRSYRVVTRRTAAFTFSAAKARAYAARTHKTLPVMPANLNGTTLHLTYGPSVIVVYGETPERIRAEHLRRGEMPRGRFLVFVQARAPRVTSTGATLHELESYMLAMPGIPPQLAAQIRALGDLSATLPIPIRPEEQTAKHVTVDGAPGLAIGDNTGLGAGVVWERDGIVYGAGGPLAEDEVRDFADGVH